MNHPPRAVGTIRAAESIFCSRCGSALTGLAPVVRCAHCGNDERIDPAKLHELARYQHDLARLGRQAATDAHSAQVWNQHYSGRGAQSRYAPLALMLIGAPAMLVSIGLAVLVESGVRFDRDLAKGIATALLFGPLVIGLAIYFVWYYSGRKRGIDVPLGASPAPSAVCQRCGAPASFAPGQVLECCRFCGAGLLAGNTVLAHGLSTAEAHARMVRLQLRRAERNGFLAMGRMANAALWLYAPAVGILGLMMVFAAIGFTIEYFDPTAHQPTPLAALLVLWAMVLAMVGGVTGILLTRHARLRRWRGAFLDLASHIQGFAFFGPDAARRWLDAFWPSAYPTERLRAGARSGALVATYRGYPLMVFVNPPTRFDGTKPHAELLVAATLPGLGEDPGDIPSPWFGELKQRMRSSDIVLQASSSGLHVTGDSKLAERLFRSPEQLRGFFSIVDGLVELLVALRAAPSVPLP